MSPCAQSRRLAGMSEGLCKIDCFCPSCLSLPHHAPQNEALVVHATAFLPSIISSCSARRCVHRSGLVGLVAASSGGVGCLVGSQTLRAADLPRVGSSPISVAGRRFTEGRARTAVCCPPSCLPSLVMIRLGRRPLPRCSSVRQSRHFLKIKLWLLGRVWAVRRIIQNHDLARGQHACVPVYLTARLSPSLCA